MYVIYMWSDSRNTKGYWTGDFIKHDRVLENGVYRNLCSPINIPILSDNSYLNAVKKYKSRQGAINAANNLPLKVKELISDRVAVKMHGSGYWNIWNIEVLDLDINKVIYKVPCGAVSDSIK